MRRLPTMQGNIEMSNPYQQWPNGPDRFSAFARQVISESSDFRDRPCSEYREKSRDEQNQLNSQAHGISEGRKANDD